MFEKQPIKIPLNQSQITIPENIIGVDSGQTLTKVAFVEASELYLSVLPTKVRIRNALLRVFSGV